MGAPVPDRVIHCRVGDETMSLTEYSIRAWSGIGGVQYAGANPDSALQTDYNWLTKYGHRKTSVLAAITHGIVPEDASWLDVGASTGAHGECLKALGWTRVYSVDLSLESLQENRGPAVQADAARLPFPDQSIDVVTTSGVLMNCGEPDYGMMDVAKECGRVAGRWLLVCEGYSERANVMTHDIPGRVMPPSVLMPWDIYLQNVLPQWTPRRGVIYPHVKNAEAYAMCVLLMERVGNEEMPKVSRGADDE